MSEPKRRRKRGDAISSLDTSKPFPTPEELDADREKRVEALLDQSRRAERDELGAMLDERFAALREDIDQKLDAIMIRLSGEVEKLSMRSAEVGDVGRGPAECAALSARAELWWEHVGQQWPSPQEELSLESIERSVYIAAASAQLDPHDLFVSVLKCYAADPKASMQPSGRSAIDLQVRLHEYLRVAVAIKAEAAK